jgi:2-oxoglutarate ferredoxin oxidoreductase subunit beta
MTGGQMAPTTLPGQITTSSPEGRDVEMAGWPVRVAELLAPLPGVAYAVRRSVHDPRHIRNAKKALKTAFQAQLAGLGLALVEILSPCPTNWNLKPTEALAWLEAKMLPYFPVGDYKVVEGLK